MKITGKVYDWAFDCGHLIVDHDGFDVLHDTLREFAGKNVEITIRACDEV